MAKLGKRGWIVVGVVGGLLVIGGGIQNAVTHTAAPAATTSTATSASASVTVTTRQATSTTAPSVTVTHRTATTKAKTVTSTAQPTVDNPEFAAAAARCHGSAGPDVIQYFLYPGSTAEGTVEHDINYPNPLDPSGPCTTEVDVFFSNSKTLAPGTCLDVAYASDNPTYDVNYTGAAAKPRKPFRKAGDSC